MAPCEANDFLAEHAALLIRSHRHWAGRDIVDPALSPIEAARALYQAPFVLLSHDTAVDPRFTYANETAQRLFEMAWDEIVGMPSSRYSAEPLARAERESLLARVAAHDYIRDYSGVRIARSGARFLVRNATVLNLIESGEIVGQAACFSDWGPVVGV